MLFYFFPETSEMEPGKEHLSEILFQKGKVLYRTSKYTNCPAAHRKNDSVSGKTCEASSAILA